MFWVCSLVFEFVFWVCPDYYLNTLVIAVTPCRLLPWQFARLWCLPSPQDDTHLSIHPEEIQHSIWQGEWQLVNATGEKNDIWLIPVGKLDKRNVAVKSSFDWAQAFISLPFCYYSSDSKSRTLTEDWKKWITAVRIQSSPLWAEGPCTPPDYPCTPPGHYYHSEHGTC